MNRKMKVSFCKADSEQIKKVGQLELIDNFCIRNRIIGHYKLRHETSGRFGYAGMIKTKITISGKRHFLPPLWKKFLYLSAKPFDLNKIYYTNTN